MRRQALALLANLLMKDYVKWRGPLFHRYIFCQDQTINKTITICFASMLGIWELRLCAMHTTQPSAAGVSTVNTGLAGVAAVQVPFGTG